MRKVRYLTDIQSCVNYALENRWERFSEEEMREHILMGRQRRLELIHKHYQYAIYTPMGHASLETKRLKVTLPDTLAFARNIGLLEISEGKVIPLPLSLKLGRIRDSAEAKMMLVKALLTSKYPAYRCFLQLLCRRSEVTIPKALSRRDRRLRLLLEDMGFRTDVPSFYTLRDLFYELEAVNWYIDSEGNEGIYPTIAFAENGVGHDAWKHCLSIDSSTLLFQRKTPKALFARRLIDSYLRLTRRRFDVEADLMSLRDHVCRELNISDQDFSRLLLETRRRHDAQITIRLSFGPVQDRKRGYASKIITLPQVASDRLALYVRLSRSD